MNDARVIIVAIVMRCSSWVAAKCRETWELHAVEAKSVWVLRMIYLLGFHVKRLFLVG
jgi:hypothetical protein